MCMVFILGTAIPVIGWFVIFPIGSLFCMSLVIVGMSNAYQRKMKELPLIGKYRIY